MLEEADEELPNSMIKTKYADDSGDDVLREATSISQSVVACKDNDVG